MKEQIKAPEKIQLSDEEIANLPDAQFKTQVIRMLTELIELGANMKEERKATLREVKQNIQGTNNEEKKPALKSMIWSRRKKYISNQNRMKKQGFKKLRRLRNLWNNFKCSNILIIGVPEGEEAGEEIENLLEKIMKENFSNLVKETDFQEVQEAQRVPKKLDPRRNTPRHIIVKLPKIKNKEKILIAAREKETVTYKGVLIRLSADFSKETFQARRG